MILDQYWYEAVWACGPDYEKNKLNNEWKPRRAAFKTRSRVLMADLSWLEPQNDFDSLIQTELVFFISDLILIWGFIGLLLCKVSRLTDLKSSPWQGSPLCSLYTMSALIRAAPWTSRWGALNKPIKILFFKFFLDPFTFFFLQRNTYFSDTEKPWSRILQDIWYIFFRSRSSCRIIYSRTPKQTNKQNKWLCEF